MDLGLPKWNASEALVPRAARAVSGPMIFSCSLVEPGQPCVTMIGKASTVLLVSATALSGVREHPGDDIRQILVASWL